MFFFIFCKFVQTIIKKHIYYTHTYIQATHIHVYFKCKLLTDVNEVYTYVCMSSYRQTFWSEWQCKLNFKEQSWQTNNV